MGCLLAHVTVRAPFSAADEDNAVVEEFAVARNGDVLLLPVAIGGHEYSFVVDTGCTCTVVDTALRSELVSTGANAQLNGGHAGHALYNLRGAQVGKTRQVVDGPTLCMDLGLPREASGYDIRGIIGMSFLKRHVIRIDFDSGTLAILASASRSSGHAFPLSYNATDLPLLDAQVAPDDSIRFIIDTGSNASEVSLTGYRFGDLVENGRLERIGASHATAGVEGQAMLRGGRLSELCIGTFKHAGVDASASRANKIGLPLLSRYIVTFDFPHDRVYLKPGKRFAEPSSFGASGIAIGRFGSKTRVKSVAPGSPADVAGVKPGDELVRIDDNDVSSMPLSMVHGILETEGRKVRLALDGPRGRREVALRVATAAERTW